MKVLILQPTLLLLFFSGHSLLALHGLPLTLHSAQTLSDSFITDLERSINNPDNLSTERYDQFGNEWLSKECAVCILNECFMTKEAMKGVMTAIDGAFGIRITSVVEHVGTSSFISKFTVFLQFANDSPFIGRFSCMLFLDDLEKIHALTCISITDGFERDFYDKLSAAHSPKKEL